MIVKSKLSIKGSYPEHLSINLKGFTRIHAYNKWIKKCKLKFKIPFININKYPYCIVLKGDNKILIFEFSNKGLRNRTFNELIKNIYLPKKQIDSKINNNVV